jgi:CheY-like chemotaxis protein
MQHGDAPGSGDEQRQVFHFDPRSVRVEVHLANRLPSDRKECLAAGMNDYVTKPIRVDALAKALNQMKAR